MHKVAAHKIYLLNKIRNFLSKEASLNIYKAKILPFFDYGDVIYHETNPRVCDKLQKLQNRALRVCLKAHSRENVETLHANAKIPMLFNRRNAHVCNYAHHRAQNISYLTVNQLTTRAHDAPLLKEIVPNYKVVKNAPAYKTAKAWNSLPVPTRLIVDRDAFKHKQKHWLYSTIPLPN